MLRCWLSLKLLSFALLVCCDFLVGVGEAQTDRAIPFAELADETDKFKTEVLLSGLDNPTGLAVHPTQAKRGPYEFLLAESGAGRVIRVSTATLDQVDEVVVDFPLGTLGESPSYRVGPLGLAFLTHRKFVVCSKGDSGAADIVAGYSLPTDGDPASAADRLHSVGPLNAKIEAGDGYQLLGLAKSDQMCYITTAGLHAQGGVLKSGIVANRLAYLQRFIDVSKKVDGLGAPGGITVLSNSHTEFLVVGLMGSRATPQDSRLVFFIPTSGELALNLPTGLHDIIGLAYSPSGQLYAADFSWHDEQAGGIYRIDDTRIDGRQTCRATKIATVVRPFALAFAPDGSLFVTAFGADPNTKQGSLIKITGAL